MLPGVFPDEVVGWIAHLITDDGPFAVGFQQVAPLGVGVVIVRFGSFALCSGGVGVHRPGQDIARTVVGPEGNGIGFLIVLPDQLIGGIVGIAGCVGAVADAGDVAVFPYEVKGTENLSP